MSFNELPDEILVRILSLLPPSDRIESTLVCRRWAQTIARSPQLLRDVWLVVDKLRIEEAETVIANNHRRYENIRFFGVLTCNFDAAFWTRAGQTLRVLELCYCSSEKLYSILRLCPKLESLKISKAAERSLLSGLPPGTNLGDMQESTRNLTHLHLDFLVSAEILKHLLNFMPNVSSIALLEFDTESDPSVLSRLPKILGASHRITMLDLVTADRSSIDDCEKLLRISSTSLQKLRCDGKVLMENAFNALLNCTMLRDLDIRAYRLSDAIHEIIRNAPELESLSIASDEYEMGLGDVMPLFDLRKLRILHIDVRLNSGGYGRVSEEFLHGLAQMPSLESVTLGRLCSIVDSTRLRILARLPRLRSLEIDSIHWEAESLGIVVYDFEKLKTLAIDGGSNCTPKREVCSLCSKLKQNPPAPVNRTRSDRQGGLESSSLEVLTFKNIPLTDACLGLILAHHSRLRTVHLSSCDNITDVGLVTLVQHEPLLEELDVSYMDNIAGMFLEPLGELCRRLRSVRIEKCVNISSQAREKFRLRRPKVKCRM